MGTKICQQARCTRESDPPSLSGARCSLAWLLLGTASPSAKLGRMVDVPSSMLAIVQKGNIFVRICLRVAVYAVTLGMLVASVTINRDVERISARVSLHARHLLA